MTRRKLLFFTADDVRKALPMREAVDAVQGALAALSAGEARMPVRAHLETCPGGVALFMPSFLAGGEHLAVKAVTVFDDNPSRGLPRIQALVTLFDAATGSPLAVMEGGSLTALRTGAASGAATDLLARKDAETVAVFGAGIQGRTQLEAVCAVRRVATARVFDPVREAAEAFASEMRDRLAITVEPAGSPTEAVRGAAIVSTATVSSRPVFDDADIAAGTHINAVGSYQPGVQELPAETLLRALVVVDHRESALAETGDLLVPIRQGLFGPEHIHAELGEIASGAKPGRTSDRQVTVFKSVGVAVEDLAAAARVLQRARELGLGREVEL